MNRSTPPFCPPKLPLLSGAPGTEYDPHACTGTHSVGQGPNIWTWNPSGPDSNSSSCTLQLGDFGKSLDVSEPPLIYFLNTYLLRAPYVLSSVLGTGHAVVNKVDKKLTFCLGKIDSK